MRKGRVVLRRACVLMVALLSFGGFGFAQEVDTAAQEPDTPDQGPGASAGGNGTSEPGNSDGRKAGVNYGLGLAGVFGERRVVGARLGADNIVRATEFARDDVRAVLTLAYYPKKLGNEFIGWGPLFTFNLGLDTDNPVNATSFGLGLMFGRRATDRGTVWGLGVAYSLDTGLSALRHDFVVGRSAPLDTKRNPLQPQFVNVTGHSVLVVANIALWQPTKR